MSETRVIYLSRSEDADRVRQIRSPDWSLPIDYGPGCPKCGGGHGVGWVCLPWKQEPKLLDMEC